MIDMQHVNGQWTAAQEYAGLNWRVVPLHNLLADGSCSCGDPECPPCSRAKHPRMKGWQKKATIDQAIISGWEKQFPAANIGVVLGKDSGLIDVEYDDEHGREVAKRVLGNIHTPTYRSGSRSIHRLFRWQKGLPGGERSTSTAWRFVAATMARGRSRYSLRRSIPPAASTNGSFRPTRPSPRPFRPRCWP